MPPHPSPLSYRADIDGLRAVAVVPVVLFHAGVGFTKGGYVGVDVFFVISGFLITSIIRAELEAQTFSFAHFYERRARRLFPALFAVLAASSVAGLALLFAPELRAFGQVLAAAVVFSANFVFAAGDDYFGRVGENAPLLHTWSLAVEEQFYLAFPLLLAIGVKRRWPLVRLLTVLALLSFAASVAMMAWRPILAFYLLPLRAWELLAGALLALGALPAITSQRWRDGLAWAGLLAILVAVGAYNKNVPFPGLTALVPVAGAVLIIWTGASAGTPVSRFLSQRPVVFVGLISYSLYLWHFPIIVFYKLAFGETLDNAERVALCLASFAVAVVSWKFIELPVRRNRLLASRRAVALASLAALLPVAALGVLLVARDGFAASYPAEVRRIAGFHYVPEPAMRSGTCFVSRATARARGVDDACLARDPSKPNVLLFGDSHAAHLYAGLAGVYDDIHVLQATASACKPIARRNGAERCWRVIRAIYQDFLPAHTVDAVVLAADWRGVAPDDVAAAVEALKKFVPKVFVVGPIVEYDDTLPRLLLRSAWRKDPRLVDDTRRRDAPAMEAALKAAVEKAGAVFVPAYSTLCADGACITMDGAGDPIQFDNAHLTARGARLLASRWRAAGIRFH